LERLNFTGESRRRFPGRHQVRCRLEHLGHQPLASFALALKVRPVNGRSGFELGEFRFERFDARLERDGDRVTIIRW
jgi:hypothetical protein